MTQQNAGGILQGSFDRGEIVIGGKAFSHKCSRITGIKICSPNFHKEFVTLDHHVQVDNKVALAYILRMGGTSSPQLLKINKSIRNYLLFRQITIAAEYLPSRLNVRAGW